MRYAILVDGVVANIIVADQAFVDASLLPGETAILLTDELFADIGWSWDGSTFTAPTVTEEETQP